MPPSGHVTYWAARALPTDSSRYFADDSALIPAAVHSVDGMPLMLRWQRLETEGGPRSVLRAKVPGGWLIWCDDYSSSESGYSGLTFMPDPTHEWDGCSL